MSIDPHLVTAVISGMVAVETAIASGTIKLTNAIPEKWIPTVVAWSAILAFVGSVITGGQAIVHLMG